MAPLSGAAPRRSRSSQPSSRATRRSTLLMSAAKVSRRRPTSSIRVPSARHNKPPTATTAPSVSQSGSMPEAYHYARQVVADSKQAFPGVPFVPSAGSSARPGRSCAPEGPSPRMATPPARSAPPVLRAVEPQARGGRHRDAALAGRGGALRAIARVGRAASRQPPERRAGDGRTPAQRRDPVRQGGPTVADARARNHPRRRQRRVDRDQRTSSGPSPGDATPGLGPLPWPESATSS